MKVEVVNQVKEKPKKEYKESQEYLEDLVDDKIIEEDFDGRS